MQLNAPDIQEKVVNINNLVYILHKSKSYNKLNI